MIFAALFELVMTHILHRKKLDDVGAEYLTKITANVQKSWSRPRWATIFCRIKIKAMSRKKLKIALLNEANFMVKLRFEGWKLCFANICAPVTWVKYLTEFNSTCFPLLSWLKSVHLVPYKYKMRGKYIWNIWTRIKWEAKLTNLNWPPSMDLNP